MKEDNSEFLAFIEAMSQYRENATPPVEKRLREENPDIAWMFSVHDSMQAFLQLENSLSKENPLGNKLVRELLKIGVDKIRSQANPNPNAHSYEELVFFLADDVIERVVEIGNELYKDDPQMPIFVLSVEALSLPATVRRGLEYAWSGIGNIQA